MKINRRAFVASLGGTAAVSLMTPDEKADALEHYMEDRLREANVLEGILREGKAQQYPTVAELEARNADLNRPYRGGAGAPQASVVVGETDASWPRRRTSSAIASPTSNQLASPAPAA